MGAQQATLPALRRAIREHYERRGFAELAISQLLRSVKRTTSTCDKGILHLHGTALKRDIGKLTALFQRPLKTGPAKSKELREADCIFAFAFGYRLRSDDTGDPQNRLPGQNNRHLAGIVARLKRGPCRATPTYVQGEIGDALEDMDPQIIPDYRAPLQDVGTAAVLDLFLRRMGWRAVAGGNSTAVLVAHAHHAGRVLHLLEDLGIRGILPKDSYDRYDPDEAQDRVKSETEFIHSDFVSMFAAC